MTYAHQPIADATATALTLDRETHANTTLVCGNASGKTITLPAATGTGDTYTILFDVTVTASDTYVIQVGDATDSFYGGVSISTDVAGVTELAVSGDDTITMDGSTAGGLLGSWVRVTDVKTNVWMLEGFICSSGNEATVFSAGV